MRLVPLKDGRHAGHRRAQRRIYPRVPGRTAQPALGGQADCGLPVGADGDLQELPGDHAAAKTRWLCKKANKRVLLTMTPNVRKRRGGFRYPK